MKGQYYCFLPIIIKYIINGSIRNDVQFLAAFNYLLEHSGNNEINLSEFEIECGANVVVTIEEIEDSVFFFL